MWGVWVLQGGNRGLGPAGQGLGGSALGQGEL